jgi:gamma-glutamyltranspeptidase/glutathione hydrolase
MLGEADLTPEGPDGWRTDVRLSSMMAPSLMLSADGGLTAMGSGGSNRIRTAILQAAVNLLAFRMPLAEAIAAPRIHVEEGRLSAEPGFAERALVETAGKLEIDRWPGQNMFFGGVHAAMRSRDGTLQGAGDERRGGVVERC